MNNEYHQTPFYMFLDWFFDTLGLCAEIIYSVDPGALSEGSCRFDTWFGIITSLILFFCAFMICILYAMCKVLIFGFRWAMSDG